MKARRWGMFVVVLVFAMLPALPARASTSITSNITTNTTWTLAGSPYIIDRLALSVSSGATLTIEPGVEVQFNKGPTSSMIIQGSLLAIGTESSRIQFEPAPLQSRWQYLKFADLSSGMLDYIDIRGSGGIASTAPWAYGALLMSSTHGVAVWHSHIYRNNNSGILATSSAALDIQYSLIEYNVYGISVMGGAINMAHSWVRQNNLGIFFNHASPPAVQSTITRSDISYNYGVGVKLNEVPTIPDDKYPSVRYSNLTDNNPDPPWTNTEQIGLLYPRWDAYPLWDDNFWGGNVLPILCPTAPWPIHLFYVELLDAGGPIPSHQYVYPGPDQKPETCDGDDLQVVGYSVVENETNAPVYPI